MRWLSVLLVSLTVVTSLRDEGGPPLDDVISSTGERDDESPTTDREHFELPGLVGHLNSTPGQKWGYVSVRPRAHIFWWLFPTTHVDGARRRPLIMWLQGGPGASSTGFGNFDIIGPLDRALRGRNTTWVQDASILFVDSPVGAGFSYVDDERAYTTDVGQVAADLLVLLTEFLRQNPTYVRVPFYIFGQSYGGKMAVVFAQKLQKAMVSGRVDCQLRGVAMGNAWISPVDSTRTWGPFLHQMSIVDERGNAAILEASSFCEEAARRRHWVDAAYLWRHTQHVVSNHSNYVDFYNILQYRSMPPVANVSSYTEDDGYNDTDAVTIDASGQVALPVLMNTVVRQYLGVIPRRVRWAGFQSDVFRRHHGDFMKHVIDNVGELLRTTSLDIVVYQGQLDLICDTKGAMDWVQRINWLGLENYNGGHRLALVDPVTSQTEMFVKAFDRFKFYWVLNAGHAVPKDQGPAARRMLVRILDAVDS